MGVRNGLVFPFPLLDRVSKYPNPLGPSEGLSKCTEECGNILFMERQLVCGGKSGSKIHMRNQVVHTIG